MGTKKLQSVFQLSSQSMEVIKWTLMECELLPLPKDGHNLFICGMVPWEMLRSCTLWEEIQSITILSMRSICAATQSITCMGSLCFDYSFINLLMYPLVGISHCQVMGISPSSGSYSDPIPNGLHSFCIQLWCNMAQNIYHSIVSSLLIFNAKCESYQWLHPMMLGGT